MLKVVLHLFTIIYALSVFGCLILLTFQIHSSMINVQLGRLECGYHIFYINMRHSEEITLSPKHLPVVSTWSGE
jgi:hypothetical protein